MIPLPLFRLSIYAAQTLYESSIAFGARQGGQAVDKMAEMEKWAVNQLSEMFHLEYYWKDNWQVEDRLSRVEAAGGGAAAVQDHAGDPGVGATGDGRQEICHWDQVDLYLCLLKVVFICLY